MVVGVILVNLHSQICFTKSIFFAADFAEVDILEEADKSDEAASKFNLEWMVKVIYTIKPSDQ